MGIIYISRKLAWAKQNKSESQVNKIIIHMLGSEFVESLSLQLYTVWNQQAVHLSLGGGDWKGIMELIMQ